jgi:hypothetical protein
MIEPHEINIEFTDLDTVAISVSPAGSNGQCEEIFGSGGLEAQVDDLLRAIYSIPNILDGEQVWLLRFADFGKRLRTRPKDEETLILDVVSTWQDDPILSVPMEKIDLCEELIETAGSFYQRAKGDRQSELLDNCDPVTFEVGLADARHRLGYYREHGTQQGYTPTLSQDHLQTIVRECKHVDRLREFVPQTDAVQAFVDELVASDDDEYVEEWYEDLLLMPDPEIPSEAAKALAENPDPRAKDALLQTRWKVLPEVVPHAFEALVTIGGDDVQEALIDYADFSNADESIRKATVEALGTFDDEAARTALSEVAADEDAPESVREAARATLDDSD